MKRVLFVATVTKHINTFHIPYLKWFKEQGYEVHVASNGNEKIEYCDKHYDLPFERFPIKKNNLKTYKELKKIIDDNSYEIVHCHTPVGGVLTRLAARESRKNGTKVIYTAHGFHFYKGAPLLNWIIYYPIEKICARWTDCLITINEEDYNFAREKFKKCKQIKHVYGVGLDTNKFDFEIKEEELDNIRKQIGINQENIVLTYVAELNKNKNQILLIKVLKELIKENDQYRLILVGDGRKRNQYEEYVKNNKLSEYVKIIGRRSDIPQILKLTNIYVASSLREGLPVNVLEAIYMGVPVVAVDNRGHRELIRSEFIIQKSNYIDFCNKVKKIDIFNNKEKFEKKYSLDNIIEELKKIYKGEI